MQLKHKDLTHQVLQVFYEVYNTLGYGFLEKVYHNAMYAELTKRCFRVRSQRKIEVYYKEQMVGEYFADLIVNDVLILELKAAKHLVEAHEYQLLNYLKATTIEVGLLLNFGTKPVFKRKIFSNERKVMLPTHLRKVKK